MAMFYAEAQYEEFALLNGEEVEMNQLIAMKANKRDLRVRWSVLWMKVPSSEVVAEKSGVEKNIEAAKKKAQKWKNKNNPERKRGVFSWL